MSREDLAVPLALVALAASIGLAAVRQADWKHKALIWSLLAIAAVLFVLGLSWYWIKDDLPQIGAAFSELAASRVTWFVIGMFGLAALLFRGSSQPDPVAGRQPQTASMGAPTVVTEDVAQKIVNVEASLNALRSEQNAIAADLRGCRSDVRELGKAVSAGFANESSEMEQAVSARLNGIWNTWDHAFQQLRKRLDALGGAGQGQQRPAAVPPAEQAPQPIESGLYVGRTDVSTSRLEGDLLLEFAFVAFNGAAVPLRFSRVRGRVMYANSTNVPDTDLKPLRSAAIRDDNPSTFAPRSEFMVVVSQYVPGELAAEMVRDLAAGNRVVFGLDGLDILLGAEGTEEVRLPIWERVTCERVGERTFTGRMAMMSTADGARAN